MALEDEQPSCSRLQARFANGSNECIVSRVGGPLCLECSVNVALFEIIGDVFKGHVVIDFQKTNIEKLPVI